MQVRKVFCCAVLAATAWSAQALALTVQVPSQGSSIVGESFSFRAVVTDAVGVVQYRWNFGDGIRTEYSAAAASAVHVYDRPGRFFVQISAQDEGGNFASLSFPHLAHYALKAQRPTSSTSIVYDKKRNRVYAVNQDNDSVTSVDADGLKKVAELPVYGRPEALAIAPDGKLWVVHRDDYAVAIVDLDKFAIEKSFRLPYASQPAGLAVSPAGKEAYVTLMAVGRLLKVDTSTQQVTGTVDVGPWPRGVSVSHDGKDVYVTRFISPDSAGEVVKVDGPAMKVVKRIQLAADTTIVDTDRAARGVPNYLFSVGISPDGRQAWVAGKKDNIFRGTARDGLPLTQDDTVRPMVAIIDTATSEEQLSGRVDLDDRSLPAHVEFSPLGDFAFVTLAASNVVEVRNVYEPNTAWSLIAAAGTTPRASVLGPANRLFVQGSLSRSVVVFDLTEILVNSQKTTPPKLAEIPTAGTEKLSADLLLGKRVFYNAADQRMTSEGYLTCATCHFDGIDDGRVFDFTSRGEGLRNTTSLLGRRGSGHGRIDWTGNFDEVQDFENQIRDHFSGRGFIPDDVLAVGTRKDPLGDSKAKLSPELDALTAFVTSLEHVNPSPFRNPDGSLTADGQAGKALFGKLGCDFCHGGRDFTDSARGILHDVGTVTAKSGMRAGGRLDGIDSPTLLGVWETAPYLHDGSAATLRDVLTTKNPDDAHGFVSFLKAQEIDQLVAYMLQLDSELPQRRLPFESPLPGGTGGSSGAPAGTGGAAGSKGGNSPTAAIGCSVAGRSGAMDRSRAMGGVMALTLLGAASLRPRRRGRGVER